MHYGAKYFYQTIAVAYLGYWTAPGTCSDGQKTSIAMDCHWCPHVYCALPETGHRAKDQHHTTDAVVKQASPVVVDNFYKDEHKPGANEHASKVSHWALSLF
jgi:hypothetical protein